MKTGPSSRERKNYDSQKKVCLTEQIKFEEQKDEEIRKLKAQLQKEREKETEVRYSSEEFSPLGNPQIARPFMEAEVHYSENTTTAPKIRKITNQLYNVKVEFEIPNCPMFGTTTVIDTGASAYCINKKVIPEDALWNGYSRKEQKGSQKQTNPSTEWKGQSQKSSQVKKIQLEGPKLPKPQVILLIYHMISNTCLIHARFINWTQETLWYAGPKYEVNCMSSYCQRPHQHQKLHFQPDLMQLQDTKAKR
ncbi:hypothetical protein Tco_0755165 [Tanacetum coccineum]